MDSKSLIKRRKTVVLKTALIAISLAAASLGSALAQPGIRHAHYLHARTKIRQARLYVEVKDSPEVHEHLHYARIEMDQAIRDLDVADVIDRGNINDHPPIDATLTRPGRLHKAVDLLREARKEIGMEEDNPAAVNWQTRAYADLDKAIESCKAAALALGVTGL